MNAEERNLLIRIMDAKIHLALIRRGIVHGESEESAEWYVTQLEEKLFEPFKSAGDEDEEE